MLIHNPTENVRNILIEWIKNDVVGPRGGPEEELPSSENPTQSYLSGILFPKAGDIDREEDEHEQVEIEGGDVNGDHQDDRIGIADKLRPSSFGLTCTVPHDIDVVKVKIEYGTYDLVSETSEKKSRVYRRAPHSETYEIQLDAPMKDIPLDADEKFAIRYSTKKHSGGLSLRVFVVNNHANDGGIKNEFKRCMFQPKITVFSLNSDCIFINNKTQRNLNQMQSNQDDSILFDLLFRNKNNFAMGHGCAVEWDGVEDKVAELRTTFVPTYTVPKIRPREMDMEGLDMNTLDQADMSEYRKLLAPVANMYERWISELEVRTETISAEFRKAAKAQINECKIALGRMRKGIEILSTDKHAADAFSFANKAMRLQISYGRWARKNAEKGKVDGPKPKEYCGRWRPFQLAFFLINIESITDPRSEDRSIVDLLWFATGGGKTEAYLGLVAFTMAHRRLRHEMDYMKSGTSVIMRYTLRLLTIQQFHRAAALMCGCEYIRRKDPKLGSEPFSVGLWVGSSTTPNTLDGEYGASTAIKNARFGNPSQEHNPIQITSCPWCGSKIDAYCYEISGAPRQCRVYCPNKTCTFSRRGDDAGLPVLTVDEDIYKRCPSLVIGTVDKFAQITWKWETGAIFGRVNKYCEKHGFVVDELAENCNRHNNHKSFMFSDHGPARLEPPELIIQDELHLISGPLGTLTGHYEMAVDLLCTNDDNIRPKIIASTATTRKAAGQIQGLFNRSTSKIFPPQGVDFGQSFFSEEVSLKEDPGKVYVGVCTTTKSRLTILGRVSAAILRCVRHIEENIPSNGISHKEIDPYYTLISYFNTLKDLGGASKMYDDTVPRYIQRLFNNFENRNGNNIEYKNQPLEKVELTSRINSNDIPDIIKRLERKLSDSIRPEDLLLCTNMLSVGVDIPRLSVMIMNGQPKNHSEYIQATGRIGREFPGLVVTSYNPLKPRDLSHYENFGYYHSTLHKNVEPVNLTPFAPRARDRALFGVLVALVRLFENRLAKNDTAGKFDKNGGYVSRVLERIRDEVSCRVHNIDYQEKNATMKDLEQCIDRWYAEALERDNLHYTSNKHEMSRLPENVYYLLRSTHRAGDNGLVTVPNSLRDAEELVKMWYLDDRVGSIKNASEIEE